MKKLFKRVEEFYDNLSGREQNMIVAAGFTMVVFVASVFLFLVSDSFSEREERIRELKGTVRLLVNNRESVQETRAILASFEMKATKKPPMLQGHLDELAKEFELGNASYTPKKSEDLGSNGEYRKEAVEVKFHDVDLKKVAQFLDKLERGPNLIMVTQLRITSRRGQHDRLDPTFVVSSFYKRSAAELKALSKKKGKKGKGKKRKGK